MKSATNCAGRGYPLPGDAARVKAFRESRREPKNADLEPVWLTMRQMVTSCTRGDRRLGLTVIQTHSGAAWDVMAAEMPANAAGPQDFLDDHTHQVIGERTTLRAAKRAALEFGEAWMKGDAATMAALCACKQIVPDSTAIAAE